MPAFKIRYRRRGIPDAVPRPWLKVGLVRGKDLSLLAIVDSGADTSVVPLSLAGSFGLMYDPSRVTVASGAGGLHQQYQATNNVTIRSEVGLVELRRPTLNPHLAILLLGRADFFEDHRITFDQRESSMLIEPYARRKAARA